jgi:integrase
MKRSGSANGYFEKRIPADVARAIAGRRYVVPLTDAPEDRVMVAIKAGQKSIRFSLRSSIPSDIKQRQAAAASFFEARFAELRDSRLVTLSHREATALAGVLYAGWAEGPDRPNTIVVEVVSRAEMEVSRRLEEREDEEMMRGAAEALGARLEAATPEEREEVLGRLVDGLMEREGFPYVSAESRRLLMDLFQRALVEGLQAHAKKAGGDYSPDPVAARFPVWEPPKRVVPAPAKPILPAGKVSLTGLVDAWWKEAEALGKSKSTQESFSGVFARLSQFLKHDDATRVTPDDILAYKDFRLQSVNPRTGEKISGKTVKGSDLAGLNVVFDWAVANRKLASNPAKGVTLKLGRQKKLRDRDFTPQEMRTILAHASSHKPQPNRKPTQTDAMKRWVPWLCAYTGARVGEIVQMRKEDVWQDESGAWFLTITPDAGTVKTDEAREVPLHAHLVELGFLDFVKSSKSGHLFMRLKPGADFRGVWKSRQNRLREFIREVITDENVQPFHGWRHTFKTIGTTAGIQERVLDVICGHAPASVGQTYGTVTREAKVKAMAMYPRYGR